MKLTLAILFAAAVTAKAADYYVATGGSDSNPGTLAAPLATIEAAVTNLAGGAGTIYLRGGTYFRTNTLNWTSTAAVTISAYNNEVVKLVGGKQITNFVLVAGAVTNRLLSAANTYQVSLPSQGVLDYGTLQQRGAPGFNESDMPIRPAALELFFNESPMTLAQYPNGSTTWAITTNCNIVDPYGATNWGYMDNRPIRWSNYTAGIWTYGFRAQDWFDSHLELAALDTNTLSATNIPPMDRAGWAANGGRFQWQNVFDELDVAGEYFVDRTNGVLYFYPPSSITSGSSYVSLLTNLVTVTNGANLTFNRITFEVCRGHAIVIDGATNVLFGNCTFKNAGNYAVWMTNAFNSGFTNCVVTQTGDGGLSIAGGNRDTLASGSNYVLNCEFSSLGYWDRMDHAAVKAYGVGTHIANCLFRDLTQNAIREFGNNHLVEYCEFTNCVTQCTDCGVIYGTKDWSGRGNVIRYNFFHDHLGRQSNYVGTIYLDDGTSGTTSYGNIFYRTASSADIMIGGGRDNISTNNIHVNPVDAVHANAEVIAYHMDGRFLPGEWAESSVPGLSNLLCSVPYTNTVWSNSYPHIAVMLTDNPAAPMYNQFTNNIISFPYWKSIYTAALPYWDAAEFTTATNIFDAGNWYNPGFTGVTGLPFPDSITTGWASMTRPNFVLTNGAPALLRNFQQIPVSLIGRMPVSYPVSTLRNVRLKNVKMQ